MIFLVFITSAISSIWLFVDDGGAYDRIATGIYGLSFTIPVISAFFDDYIHSEIKTYKYSSYFILFIWLWSLTGIIASRESLDIFINPDWLYVLFSPFGAIYLWKVFSPQPD